MPYVLGVHLGGTATSAAIARRDGNRWGSIAPIPLGAHGPTIPTLLHRGADGTFVVGEAARRHLPYDYDGISRGFTDTIGTDVPLLVGDEFVPPQRLAAIVVEWVTSTVAQRHGRAPDHVVVAHPGDWDGYQGHVLGQALSRAGLPPVTVLPEPVAVGLDYASRQPVEDGSSLVICDAGGTALRASVLRSEQAGFTVQGSVNVEHPCGEDLDDVLFGYVREEVGDHLDSLDLTEPQVRQAVFGLRAECARAKKTLSKQAETTINVMLPGLRTQVPVTRSKYEQDIGPDLEQVPELLHQALHTASMSMDQVDAIVLSGGNARVPAFKTVLTQHLAPPVQVDLAPELVAARGSTASAIGAVSGRTPRAQAEKGSAVKGSSVPGGSSGQRSEITEHRGSEVLDPEPAPEEAVPPRPPVEFEPPQLQEASEQSRAMLVLKLSVAGLLIAVGLVLTFMPGHGLSPHTGSSMFQGS